MNSERTAIVLDFEDRRFAAMETNDVAALEAVLADDLHYTHANGMVEDKAEVIRRIASGERVYRTVRLVTTLDYTAVYRDHDPGLFVWQATKSYSPE